MMTPGNIFIKHTTSINMQGHVIIWEGYSWKKQWGGHELSQAVFF